MYLLHAWDTTGMTNTSYLMDLSLELVPCMEKSTPICPSKSIASKQSTKRYLTRVTPSGDEPSGETLDRP